MHMLTYKLIHIDKTLRLDTNILSTFHNWENLYEWFIYTAGIPLNIFHDNPFYSYN